MHTTSCFFGGALAAAAGLAAGGASAGFAAEGAAEAAAATGLGLVAAEEEKGDAKGCKDERANHRRDEHETTHESRVF